jgi:hypothetical protein
MSMRYTLFDLLCASLLTALSVMALAALTPSSLPPGAIVVACVLGFVLSLIFVALLGSGHLRRRWYRLVLLMSGCLVGFTLPTLFWLLILLPMQEFARYNMREREHRAEVFFRRIAIERVRYYARNGIFSNNLSEIGLSETAAADVPMYTIRMITRESPEGYRVLAVPVTNELRALVGVPSGGIGVNIWAKEMPQDIYALLREAALDADDMRRLGWVCSYPPDQ